MILLNNKLTPHKWQILLSFLLEFISDVCSIQCWRSFWNYLDLHLLKEDRQESAIASLIIGSLIYLFLYILNKNINVYSSQIAAEHTESDTNSINQIESLKLIKLSMSDETNEWSKMSQIFRAILLNLTFLVCFIGTIFIWRGVWELQLIYCYPKLIESEFWNQNILNICYFGGSVLIMWKLNILACLASRSACEDNYFKINGNFILDHNLFTRFVNLKFVKKKDSLIF